MWFPSDFSRSGSFPGSPRCSRRVSSNQQKRRSRGSTSNSRLQFAVPSPHIERYSVRRIKPRGRTSWYRVYFVGSSVSFITFFLVKRPIIRSEVCSNDYDKSIDLANSPILVPTFFSYKFAFRFRRGTPMRSVFRFPSFRPTTQAFLKYHYGNCDHKHLARLHDHDSVAPMWNNLFYLATCVISRGRCMYLVQGGNPRARRLERRRSPRRTVAAFFAAVGVSGDSVRAVCIECTRVRTKKIATEENSRGWLPRWNVFPHVLGVMHRAYNTW